MRLQARTFAVGLAIIAVAGAVTFGQQQPPASPSPGTISVLENYLEALRQQLGIPGMSATLLRDGQTVWEKGYGFQNVAARIRATPDTPYMVGDLSDTIAAVLLLQCVEQRRIELDKPIGTYGLSAPDAQVTVRQLLTHAAPDGPKPFVYSPDRYAQLTAVMEWCAPQSYRKSVAHRILDHLSMIDSVPGSDLRDPNLQLPDDLFEQADVDRYRHSLEKIAIPYKVLSKTRIEQSDIPLQTMTAAGGLVSTVRDLARFDAALNLDSDTGTLLLPETRDAAWTPATGRDGSAMPTGLGWFVQSYKGERIVWQFGQIANAYSSLLIKIPSRNLTFILLANSDGLSSPFPLSSGDLTKSLFGVLFLRLAV
jgi:CubicO group peptidase (beta-lactamase class C family)